MAYCVATEIQSEFKALDLDNDSAVKTAEVTQYIVEADALINSMVGMRYVVPVTAGDGLNLLKLFSRSLVANRVRGRLNVTQAVQKDGNQNPAAPTLSNTAIMAQLTAIQNGQTNLAGAVLLNSGGQFYSDNSANDVCPVFQKDRKQW